MSVNRELLTLPGDFTLALNRKGNSVFVPVSSRTLSGSSLAPGEGGKTIQLAKRANEGENLKELGDGVGTIVAAIVKKLRCGLLILRSLA